jgi:hypothetical protein
LLNRRTVGIQKLIRKPGEVEEKKYRIKDTDSFEFWETILNDKKFHQYVEDKYRVARF